MRVLDLFSGIGGFSLGLESTGGFTTAAFCELADYPAAVLAERFPGVPVHRDIRALRCSPGDFDVVCGGFPCQDISIAGKGAGLTGERSGLWFEMLRVIDEARPRYVIAENVSALRSRGLDEVLRGLAAIGYDAEWHCIPASAIGAPHRRDRVWIVGHPNHEGRRVSAEAEARFRVGGIGPGTHNTLGVGRVDVADADRGGRGVEGDERDSFVDEVAGHATRCVETVADAGGAGLPQPEQPGRGEPLVTAADVWRAASECGWRRAESDVGRIDDGVPSGVDRYAYPAEGWEAGTPRTVGKGSHERRRRLMALGNAVVPAIPRLLGFAVLRHAQGVSE